MVHDLADGWTPSFNVQYLMLLLAYQSSSSSSCLAGSVLSLGRIRGLFEAKKRPRGLVDSDNYQQGGQHPNP